MASQENGSLGNVVRSGGLITGRYDVSVVDMIVLYDSNGNDIAHAQRNASEETFRIENLESYSDQELTIKTLDSNSNPIDTVVLPVESQSQTLRDEVNEKVGELTNVLVSKLNKVNSNIGNKADLSTNAKTNIVSAINELVSSISAVNTDLADNYSNTQVMTSQIEQAVADAKAEIRGGITDADLDTIQEIVTAFQSADGDIMQILNNINAKLDDPVALFSDLTPAKKAEIAGYLGFLTEAQARTIATTQANIVVDERVGTTPITDFASIATAGLAGIA